MAGYGSSDYTPTIEQVRDVALLGAIDAAGGEQNLDFPGFEAMLDRALNNLKAEAWDEGFYASSDFYEGKHPGKWVNDKPRAGMRTWVQDDPPANPYRKAGDDE